MSKGEFKIREIAFFDVRTVEKHIGRGEVSRADYEKHLEKLEDCAELAVPSTVQFVHSQRNGD